MWETSAALRRSCLPTRRKCVTAAVATPARSSSGHAMSGRHHYSFFFFLRRGHANQPWRAHRQRAPPSGWLGVGTSCTSPPCSGADSITGHSIYRNRGSMVGVYAPWPATKKNGEGRQTHTSVKVFQLGFRCRTWQGETGAPVGHSRTPGPQIGSHHSAYLATDFASEAAQRLNHWTKICLHRRSRPPSVAPYATTTDITMTRASHFCRCLIG
jgi:hypothetical protein